MGAGCSIIWSGCRSTYFEKRHIGDILSRFISLEPIRNSLAEGLITAVIDGLMGRCHADHDLHLQPGAGLVVTAAFLLYLMLRLALYRQFRERSEAAIRSKAQENSTFIETLRAIQSLKLFNRENEREGQWLNRYAEVDQRHRSGSAARRSCSAP